MTIENNKTVFVSWANFVEIIVSVILTVMKNSDADR
jgi:hypothetical protein